MSAASASGWGSVSGLRIADSLPAGNVQKMLQPGIDAAGISQIFMRATDPDIRFSRPEVQAAHVEEAARFQFVRRRTVLCQFARAIRPGQFIDKLRVGVAPAILANEDIEFHFGRYVRDRAVKHSLMSAELRNPTMIMGTPAVRPAITRLFPRALCN